MAGPQLPAQGRGRPPSDELLEGGVVDCVVPPLGRKAVLVFRQAVELPGRQVQLERLEFRSLADRRVGRAPEGVLPDV
eukprot:1055330-Lingulodinium_polyedra.AAC.1